MSIHSHIFASLLISLLPIAHADGLGVVGPTYDIAEPDLLEVIQSSLYQMEKNGELSKKQGEYRDRVIGAVEKPKPVPGIKATAVKRTFYYDPMMILDHDIRGEDGAILFARGLKVNPLDHVSLREELIFFDGRDRRQVSFAKQTMRKLKGAATSVSHTEETIKELRADRQFAVEYLKAALKELDDPDNRAAGLLALRDVAEAYGGLGAVAAQAGISREALYRSLSPKGNPTLKTLLAVLKTVGMRLSVEPENHAHA